MMGFLTFLYIVTKQLHYAWQSRRIKKSGGNLVSVPWRKWDNIRSSKWIIFLNCSHFMRLFTLYCAAAPGVSRLHYFVYFRKRNSSQTIYFSIFNRLWKQVLSFAGTISFSWGELLQDRAYLSICYRICYWASILAWSRIRRRALWSIFTWEQEKRWSTWTTQHRKGQV